MLTMRCQSSIGEFVSPLSEKNRDRNVIIPAVQCKSRHDDEGGTLASLRGKLCDYNLNFDKCDFHYPSMYRISVILISADGVRRSYELSQRCSSGSNVSAFHGFWVYRCITQLFKFSVNMSITMNTIDMRTFDAVTLQ